MDWDDPFSDPDDPAAREREERRREREARRREREAKRAGKPAPAPEPPPEPDEESRRASEEEPPRASEEEPGWTPDEEPRWTPDEEPRWAPEDEGDPALAVAAGAPRPGRGGGRGGVLGSLARHPLRIVAVLAALVVLWFCNALFQPFHGDGSGRVPVVVPAGSSVAEVGDLLAEKGVIDNSTLFQIRVTLAGKRSDIYAGRFTLAEGMSYGAAIDALSVPPVKRALTVTIPEGHTRSEAAQLVKEAGVRGNYVKATRRSRHLDPADYGGRKAKDLEGFLFPNTFELRPGAPVQDLVQLQLEDFKRKIKGVDMRYAKSKNLTVYDVLTIASMIEDEVGVDKQRRLVASVIYNRLREGIPLGIDATIRFATGNWSRPLTESELAIDSPYNTRTNHGLPPGPINSPGLASIRAAARPAETDFIYYVTKPHTCGELSFSKTDAEFQADVRAYQQAREAAGGRNPVSCD